MEIQDFLKTKEEILTWGLRYVPKRYTNLYTVSKYVLHSSTFPENKDRLEISSAHQLNSYILFKSLLH